VRLFLLACLSLLSLAIRATAPLALECGDFLSESLIVGLQTMPIGRLLFACCLSVDELLVEVVKGLFVVILILHGPLELVLKNLKAV